MGASFTLDSSNFKSPKVMQQQLLRACYATVKYWDGPIETRMKQNAPWRDRTTNARNGLFAKASRAGDKFRIVLGHSVDYGIYLERGTRYMKARPIIGPTIQKYAPQVIATLTKILDRL